MEVVGEKETIRPQQEAIRLRAVRRILAGENPEFISTVFKVHRSSIYNWLKAYRDGEYEALKSRPITGRPRKLTDAQELQLLNEIIRKNPLKLKHDSALWTREIVLQHLKDKYLVEYSAVQAGRLLKTFGISCDKPFASFWKRNPIRVERRWEDEYPEIREAAREEKAELYFLETKELRPDPKIAMGLREKERAKGDRRDRRKLYLLSAVTTKGSMRFMVMRGKPTPARFVTFLERLLHGAEKPVYLIGDGAPYQWHQRVRYLLKETQGRLKLFYLHLYKPGYD